MEGIDPETVKSRNAGVYGALVRNGMQMRGVFRFGRRPIDLYRRVYAGINGTPMPAHYDMQITEEDGTPRPLNEEDVWDLVFFVRSLSDKPMHTPPADDHDDHEEGGH